MAVIGFKTQTGSQYYLGTSFDNVSDVHVSEIFVVENLDYFCDLLDRLQYLLDTDLIRLERNHTIVQTSLRASAECEHAVGKRIFMVLTDGRQAITSSYVAPIYDAS